MEDSVEKVIIEVVFDPVEAKTEVIKDHDKISQIVKCFERIRREPEVHSLVAVKLHPAVKIKF